KRHPFTIECRGGKPLETAGSPQGRHQPNRPCDRRMTLIPPRSRIRENLHQILVPKLRLERICRSSASRASLGGTQQERAVGGHPTKRSFDRPVPKQSLGTRCAFSREAQPSAIKQQHSAAPRG